MIYNALPFPSSHYQRGRHRGDKYQLTCLQSTKQGQLMAKDFVTVKSSIRLPHTRIWHTTVACRSATIVYGGYAPEETLKDQISVVFYHKSGTWTKQNTYRDFPKHPQCLGANVVNDKMFVFGDDEGKMVVYSLDLHIWIWESFAPSGTSPLGGRLKIASWVARYIVLVPFLFRPSEPMHMPQISFSATIHISTNSWEWPNAVAMLEEISHHQDLPHRWLSVRIYYSSLVALCQT